MGTAPGTVERLRHWIAGHRRVFALTGAGCSTASGIPDYRDDLAELKIEGDVGSTLIDAVM
jgi:hypothetical protein